MKGCLVFSYLHLEMLLGTFETSISNIQVLQDEGKVIPLCPSQNQIKSRPITDV